MRQFAHTYLLENFAFSVIFEEENSREIKMKEIKKTKKLNKDFCAKNGIKSNSFFCVFVCFLFLPGRPPHYRTARTTVIVIIIE